VSDNFTTLDYNTATGITLAASDDGTAKASKIVSFLAGATATNTRPADTNAYTANDAVTNSTSAPTTLTFTSCARANGMGGVITGAQLVINKANAVTAEFHLWLFSASPTMTNDNAAFAPSTGDSANVTGSPIIFTGADMSDGSNSRIYNAINLPKSFKCGGSTTSLFGELQTRTAYTPTSAETYQITLYIIQET
jgi:hypothetical protein